MNKIRFFDLFIFTILAILSEFLSSYFFNKVGSQFYLSFATLIFIIASIRWGAYSVFVIILSGIPLLFTQNQNDVYSGILYYCIRVKVNKDQEIIKRGGERDVWAITFRIS